MFNEKPSKKGQRKVDPIDKNASLTLRFLRLWQGISQKKLADKLGLTFQQVQKYECGLNRMSVSTIYQMARALGVSINAFFPEPNDIKQHRYLFPLSEDEIDFLKMYRTIQKDNERKQLLALAKILSGHKQEENNIKKEKFIETETQ